MAENRIKNWKSPSELVRYFRDDKNRFVDGKSITDEQRKVLDGMVTDARAKKDKGESTEGFGNAMSEYRQKCEEDNWTPEYREYMTGKSNIPRNDIFDVEDP